MSTRTWRPAFVTISGLLLTALAHPSCVQPTAGMPLPITRFRSEPYAFLQYSGFEQPATLVVRDQQTWQSAWGQLFVNYSQKPPLPAIDFSREMIVIAAAGTKSTGGYNIVLTGASETDGVVTIQVLE